MKQELLGEIYLSADQIQARVKQLGEKISTAYRAKELVLVGILRASFVFMADLVG